MAPDLKILVIFESFKVFTYLVVRAQFLRSTLRNMSSSFAHIFGSKWVLALGSASNDDIYSVDHDAMHCQVQYKCILLHKTQ